MPKPTTIVNVSGARLQFGNRTLWQDLQVSIKAGEYIAVLGPNGSGKTTFLKVLLGLVPLTSGTVRIDGKLPGKNNGRIGYIPQQKNFDRSLPIRGRDLVGLGLTGNHFGFGLRTQESKRRIQAAIISVQAEKFADAPIGLLSGGEQQRLRIAQAIVSKPNLMLCDEPLLSLDLQSQSSITSLLNEYRVSSGAAIIFVTHEINPILPWVNRVLYIANGKWIIDTPNRVLQTRTLSELYGSSVEVFTLHGRTFVIGTDEAGSLAPGAHHEEPV